MLKGASVYWVVRAEEYQCSCRFISWHCGYRNLGVFPAVQPVLSSWSAIQLSNTGHSKNSVWEKKNPAETSRFIHSLKLPFNNKGLAQSELIQNDNTKAKVSETCTKISIIWKWFALYLWDWFMLKPNINLNLCCCCCSIQKGWNWMGRDMSTSHIHYDSNNLVACRVCNVLGIAFSHLKFKV